MVECTAQAVGKTLVGTSRRRVDYHLAAKQSRPHVEPIETHVIVAIEADDHVFRNEPIIIAGRKHVAGLMVTEKGSIAEAA